MLNVWTFSRRAPLQPLYAVLFLALVLVMAVINPTTALAQQVNVVTGGPKGTYAQMFREISKYCASSLSLAEQNTSGSLENIDMIVGNQANAGLVQSDVLFFRQRTEDLSMIKALIPLHPEEVHFLTRADGIKESSGWFGWKKNTVFLNDFSELRGRNVAAVGGSLITAKVLAANTGIDYNVIEAGSNDEALEWLKEGKVDAVVMVMGAPAAQIDAYGESFKLLPITGEALERATAKVYTPVKLNYRKLTKSTGVQSVAVQALFVTQDYETERMKNALLGLRECVYTNLPKLKETTGMHPKWRQVKANDTAQWPMYK